MIQCPICKNGASEKYQILVNHESIFFCSESCLNLYAQRLRAHKIGYASKVPENYQIEMNLSEGEED